jgi:SNF2 family DNA or RNA helicase
MKFIPRKYTEKAIAFMVQRNCAGLFLEPGLGKTGITLAAFKVLKKREMVKGMLVVAPLRPAQLVWPKEVEKWEDFHSLKIVVLHGPKKDIVLDTKADIYVINPEGLTWLRTRLSVMRKDTWPFDMLVVDESTKFKHTNTLRFKTLSPLLPKFRRRYILTGSPTPNTLIDIFGQMYIMDLGATFGPYITNFRRKYCYQEGPKEFNTWTVQPGAEKLIYDAIAPKVLQMTADDYLTMPEMIVNDIVVELPPKARKAYDEMENLLRSQMDKGVVTAANAGTASNKCRQIASGGVYMTDKTWSHVHDAKTDALIDLLEEMNGSPLLIAYETHHDLDRITKGIKKAFGKKVDVPFIGGGVSTVRAREIEDAWNKGKLPWLLGQPASMSHGLNFQESGNAICWYTPTWNYEDYYQFNRRVWRSGQKASHVIFHRILARNTLDYAVVRALEYKNAGQTEFFAAIKEYWATQPRKR